MFEGQLDGVAGDRRALADLAAELESDLRLAGCRKLMVAAAWADAPSTVDHPDGGLLVERLVSMGPAGTPSVAETAPAGLVGPFHTSTRGARAWIGDALTVRHRLPRLWDRVIAGEVYAWQARQIAQLTSDLSVATVGLVDEQISPWITQLSWPSLLNALEATIAQTDQAAYQQREQLAAAKRDVRATASEHGLRTLIARGEAGDVAMLMALHQRVAECLAEEGDEDPLPVRLSTAIGWIAQPVRCLDLLARHADDHDARLAADLDPEHCTCGTPDTKITKRLPSTFRPPGWRPLTPTQLASCAPTVVMHVHLTDQTLRHNHGVVRTDAGPILLEQLKRFLVQHDATIKVHAVTDPAATASADSYEIPLRLRRAMAIRHPRSVFPHSPTSRRLDLDHTPVYVTDGPPGQTSMATLGPLARSEHRAKTVGHWQNRQPEPGTYLWRSPEDWIMITTNQGTLTLGHTTWAQQLWNAAA